MRVGTIYRASNQVEKQNPSLLEVDGCPNFYYHTAMQGKSKIQFQRGIHQIARVTLPDNTSRVPAIILSSSPHRYGTETTPWEDIYDPDFGRTRYYGDNKSCQTRPEDSQGNKALLNAFHFHSSPIKQDKIDNAIPILFFERVAFNNSQKGYLKFQGFGVIESIELVTQYDVQTQDGYFSNYVFDMCVFSLKEDNEDFSWDWINARRDPNLSNEDTLKYAPTAWKQWIKSGDLSKVRRHVYTSEIVKTIDQEPKKGSKEEKTLNTIYEFFSSKDRHAFELFAMRIAQEIFESSGTNFQPGWVTQKSGDGGIDFVARSDIGDGLAKIKMVLIGQAKCENPDVATNGVSIARTVSRLKRGWLGIYVTTSYFSVPVQKEVLDDQYPVMLINGLQIAKATEAILYREGICLEALMNEIFDEYPSKCKNRRPEEILFD